MLTSEESGSVADPSCRVCETSPIEIADIISTIRNLLPSKLLSEVSRTVTMTVTNGFYDSLGVKKSEIDSLLRTLKNAATEAATLAANPLAFVSLYVPVLRSFQKLLEPKDTLALYNTAGASFATIFAGSSNASLVRYIAVVLVAEKARVLATAPIETATEAVALRTEIVDEIDALMLTMPDDATFQALATLKAATVEAIDELKARAKTTSKYTVWQPASIFPIAHRIYGDASRTDELIERNGIKNPALVPGGTVLEVLS